MTGLLRSTDLGSLGAKASGEHRIYILRSNIAPEVHRPWLFRSESGKRFF